MARTLYFADGSHEVLFCDEYDTAGNSAALERILRERLGSDTADLFSLIMKDNAEMTDEMESEIRRYELSCESYRNCLQTVFDGVGEAAEILVQKRVDKQKLDTVLCRLITTINNEL